MKESPPDWQAKAASEARDEQRRHPKPYPSTERERLETEYTPESKDYGTKDADDGLWMPCPSLSHKA